MDALHRIQNVLLFEENCCSCIRGVLVKENSETKCLVAHINRIGDNALLVYQDPTDGDKKSPLNLLYALPIRGAFALNKVINGASTANGNGNEVRFQVITDENIAYLFEVKTSDETMRFLLEVKNAITEYRQKAHMIGVPDFNWLDRYHQQISRKSFDMPVPGATSAASQSEDGLDVFGMPGFTPTDTILHPSPSESALTALDKVDRGSAVSSSPIFTRKSVLPSNFGARDGFIKLHMATREADYIEVLPYKFFIGTWNVNGKSPVEGLGPWLTCDDEAPDVVVVGFQELDLSTEALLMSNVTSSSTSSKEEDWQRAVDKALRLKGSYIKVRSIRLVGIFLLVYTKTLHMPHIKDVAAEYVATGIMGMMGNKGGVAIRMSFHNSTLCFVNSHLAAHQEEYERRNQDYRDILSKLNFTRVSEVLTILDHDVTFWLGDLNYRVNMECELSKGLIDQGRLEELLKCDQLIKQKEVKKCFSGFHEPPITFRPTYKYDPGTDNWDSSEKGRAPAWCDRVLYRGHGVKQIAYRSHPSLKVSDHKPVSGLFSVGVKVVNREKEKQVYEEVVRSLDRQENESLPQVKLGTTEIKFKNVQFLEKTSKILEIENTGQVVVQFSFIPKLDDNHFCKPWLSIKPNMGIIMPENTKQVKVSAYVNKETAGALNSGEDKMEDILVLHLEGGKDFFITVTGSYCPSVFGSSLEALVHMYGPIREVPVANLIDLEHGQDSSASGPASQRRAKEALEIPKELWLLVDHLYKYGASEENILKQSGFEQEIQQIRTHLDTGSTGKMPGSIHSVAEALLIFLEALPVPVIPFGFYQKALECCNNYILCKQLICQLPECHRNAFTYLTAFLRELLLSSTENKLDAKTLATLFGTLLLRAPKDEESAALSKRAISQLTQKKARFVYHFLINEFDGGMNSA
ncbi:inositol polyphosphate 5-phosphatase OCRL isoform X3 [Nematostella vectensis]|uniref:inositol polyphosphate 5-phosphatase OCRL isoform X3 n=1 Tax=Nematostella vectensis TaxID=45351 RepID=UPI002076DD59|nr:inositol polyphosphate 5-phosphatase OCRL isoform X3 [Nematostella vectensis]